MPLLVRSPEADILAAYATGFGDYVAEWGPGQAWKWNPQPRTAPVSSQTPDSGALANFKHQPYSPEAALLHIPVDTLGVKALAAGAGLDDAESTYSRFCSVQPDGTQLYCEVSPTTPDTPAQFANIVKGPPAEALWLLIRGASQLDQILAQNYELRLLNIPALYFEGLRLLAVDQGNDIVIALTPLGEKVQPGTVLSSTELLNLAQPVAAARLAAKGPNLMTA